jgi:Na+-translocating ferredoxin:NAD+ oxidoreductase RnfG subunit
MESWGYAGGSINFIPFTKQFSGIRIEDCSLKKVGGDIDAITGATVSSNAIIDTVKSTALEKVGTLKFSHPRH